MLVTQEAGSPKDSKEEVKLLAIDKMEKMSHSELYTARSNAKTPEEQKHIAPYEHRAFAREYVEENPISGSIGLAVAIPAYQAYKAVGSDSRTGVQGKQVTEGYKGVGEGLANAVKKPWERLWNDSARELATPAPEGPRKPWERFAAPVPARAEGSPDAGDDKFNTVFQALIKQESGGKHSGKDGKLTTSPVGAQGITQVMPKTGASPGFGVTPIQNNTEQEYVRFGKDYLSAMLKEFNGDYELALAAYNYGPAGVKKAVEKGEKYGHSWKNFIPKETQDYIKKINR